MSRHARVRRGLLAATLAAAFAAAAPSLAPSLSAAEQAKIPSGLAAEIKKKLEPLYNGNIDFEDKAKREQQILEIEKVLDKDKDKIALKNPGFWADCIQESRYVGGKRTPDTKSKGKVFAQDMTVNLKDGKTTKTKLSFRSGPGMNTAKPWPLLITVLEKGMDPKTYLEGTWAANAAVAKEWVVAAVVEGDDFPIGKDASVVLAPFAELIDKFNVDSNRWYLEGVGDACEGVQTAASTILPHRLAGLILRGPKKEVTSVNSALYPTLVVHAAGSAEGKAVAEAYKKIDEKNVPVEIAEGAGSVTGPSDAVVTWCVEHKRTVPASYTFATTLTDTEGEPFLGTLYIQSTAKRGLPTKVTVKYLKDTNTVDIQSENLGEFGLYMNDDLLNLDNDVTVVANGKQLVKRKFERQLREIFECVNEWGEQGRAFTVRYIGMVPAAKAEPAAAPGDKGAEKKDGGGAPAEPPK